MALGVTAYSEAPFSAEDSDVIIYASGIEMTMQENTPAITADANVSVTGTPLTAAAGTVLGSSFVLVSTTGQALTSNLGNATEIAAGQQVDVTGFDLTANGNNLTHDTLTAFGESPFATLSPATFNIPVGVEATTGGIVGTFPLPMTLGNVTEITADALVPLTGFPLTLQENNVAVFADANLSVTGFPLSMVQGTALGFTDVTTEDVAGIAMSSSLGSVFAFANVDVSITGIAMTMNPGTATVTGDATVTETGLPMTAALGTAILDANTLVDVTGQAMTMQEGTVTAPDSLAILTGFGLTIELGSPKTVVWTQVNTGTAPTWTEVDTAA